VFGVAGSEQERYRSAPGGFQERLPGGGVGFQFGKVTLAEGFPTGGVVPKPAPQRIARPCLAQPAGQLQILAAEAARPQAVHQVAFAIRWQGRFVNTFYRDH